MTEIERVRPAPSVFGHCWTCLPPSAVSQDPVCLSLKASLPLVFLHHSSSSPSTSLHSPIFLFIFHQFVPICQISISSVVLCFGLRVLYLSTRRSPKSPSHRHHEAPSRWCGYQPSLLFSRGCCTDLYRLQSAREE